MQNFTVVPAIDLKQDRVVHARGGARDDYRPIETPLGPADNPIAIARGLLAVAGSSVLYVADLDAIAGKSNHFELCRELSDALPQAQLWIDAGFSNVTDCAFWLPLGATLVIGSESLHTIDDWRELRDTYGEGIVLSLDFGEAGLIGPADILSQTALWPARLIVMSLDRVGTGQGPDLDRLKTIAERAEGRAVHAAGGVRNAKDLSAVAAAGAHGALLATALHDGRITKNEIAALNQGGDLA